VFVVLVAQHQLARFRPASQVLLGGHFRCQHAARVSWVRTHKPRFTFDRRRRAVQRVAWTESRASELGAARLPGGGQLDGWDALEDWAGLEEAV